MVWQAHTTRMEEAQRVIGKGFDAMVLPYGQLVASIQVHVSGFSTNKGCKGQPRTHLQPWGSNGSGWGPMAWSLGPSGVQWDPVGFSGIWWDLVGSGGIQWDPVGSSGIHSLLVVFQARMSCTCQAHTHEHHEKKEEHGCVEW